MIEELGCTAAAATRERCLVPPGDLRWRCSPEEIGLHSTADAEPMHGFLGQDDAVDALRFGLETAAPGQHVYVRGLTGTGRMQLVRRLLEEVQPACPIAPDRCYVHNFEHVAVLLPLKTLRSPSGWNLPANGPTTSKVARDVKA